MDSKIIAIPAELNNRPDDTVAYTAIYADPYDKGKRLTQEYEGAACYSAQMQMLPTTEFRLRPLRGKSLLPFDIFERWVALCIENGVMPPDSKPSRSGSANHLHIPASNVNRHVVYAGLCNYRWSENQPGTPYATVKAMEAAPELDFFQALHFGAAQRVYWLIHSYTHLMMAGKNGNFYGGTTAGENYNRFLPYSVALAQFYRPAKGVSLAEKKRSATNTLDPILAVLSDAGIPMPLSKPQEVAPYMLKSLEQLLSNDLKHLYQPMPPGELNRAVLQAVGAINK